MPMRIVSILAILVILSAPCYSQDNSENRALSTVEGGVTSVDWVGAVISVNNNIMISVPSNTVIYKGEDQISLSDVNMGDPVTVTYYDDPPGVHKAFRIIVQYNGDFAV